MGNRGNSIFPRVPVCTLKNIESRDQTTVERVDYGIVSSTTRLRPTIVEIKNSRRKGSHKIRTIVGGTTRDDSTKLKQKQKHKHHGGPITQQHARIQQSVRT